ncbi:MAG: hypothetical protein M1827_005068 [Pycnora praestabilis]|nr:MAG: hypothetical protein M1827_005068 [Pycnora praestabilis]
MQSSEHPSAHRINSDLHPSRVRTWTPSQLDRPQNEADAPDSPDFVHISESEFSSRRSSFASSISSVYKTDTPFTSTPLDSPLGTTQPPINNDNEEKFLKDLCNYIPLGCLPVRYEGDHDSYRVRQPWREAYYAEQALCPDSIYFAPLQQLLRARWIRIFYKLSDLDDTWAVVRFYVLPDDAGRRYVERSNKTLRTYLKRIIPHLDVSQSTWKGEYVYRREQKLSIDNEEQVSLFYLFNTLPSPAPSILDVPDKYTRIAMENLLDPNRSIKGLKTPLYPYQRRSAAMMLEKETSPNLQLDPRLREIVDADGAPYYYDQEECIIVRNRRQYESARGGILAETMGLGKTLICLAVILASKHHWPRIPVEHSEGLLPRRKEVGSLQDMVAATIGRSPIPWKPHFDRLRDLGEDHKGCVDIIKQNIGSYEIPGPLPKRLSRATVLPKPRKIQLCPCTLIIVPPNLLQQWRTEITKHTDEGSLHVLVMEGKKELPSMDELSSYDIVLFSRTRWERETRDGEDSKGRRTPFGTQELKCNCSYIGDTRERDCQCFRPDQVYNSSLRQLHWLRIIVDEGHSFASSGTKAIAVVDKVAVDRRWIVSGTPSKGLMGVEVELAVNEHSFQEGIDVSEQDESQKIESRKFALESRKAQDAWIQERADVEKLGHIAIAYLKMRPWANTGHEDPAPSWTKHIYMSTSQKGSFGGYSRCLRSTLESMVVKHRPEDVDIKLPPLYNRLVYIEPSFYDKLSINLFVMVLTSNAITSEREDSDYLFHPKNKKELSQLIANLRQSGFFWSGFTTADINGAVEVSQAYLDKSFKRCGPDDCQRLREAITVGEAALASRGWKSFSHFHELGVFVDDFPEGSTVAWALDERDTKPLLLGISQLIAAQNHVNDQLYAGDPRAGLHEAGLSAMTIAREQAESTQSMGGFNKKGVPTSSLNDEPKHTEKRTISRVINASPRKRANQISSKRLVRGDTLQPVLKSAMKRTRASDSDFNLPLHSDLVKTKICGTASSKLSYLIDRILTLHKEEKVLVFYEGDNIAYYIAQALELLDVKFLIYAKSLPAARRAAYVVTFNTTETFRVLLMDVHQASHGLNMSSASRVFFVNAVWQPNVEAQAIKRAHRIGQTRPVFVETLVLRDTLEDQMLQRRKAMTTQEHQRAERSLLDDNTMSSIIQNAKFLPMSNVCEAFGYARMASLKTPQQVFARPGRGGAVDDDPDADLVSVSSGSTPPKPRRTPKAQSLSAFGVKSKDTSLEGDGTKGDDSISMTPTKKRMNKPSPKKKVARFAFDSEQEDLTFMEQSLGISHTCLNDGHGLQDRVAHRKTDTTSTPNAHANSDIFGEGTKVGSSSGDFASHPSVSATIEQASIGSRPNNVEEDQITTGDSPVNPYISTPDSIFGGGSASRPRFGTFGSFGSPN